MPLAQTVLFSTESNADFSMANDLTGQLKTFFLTDPKVSVKSDNNPGPGATARVVVLQIGNSTHYLKLLAFRTGVQLCILKQDGVTNEATFPATVVNYVLNNSNASLVHGANIFAVHFGSTIDHCDVIYFLDSSGHFWCGYYCVGDWGGGGFCAWYTDSDDAIHTIETYPTTRLTSTGAILSIPPLLVDSASGGYLTDVTPVALYTTHFETVTTLQLVDNNIYVDGNGKYLYFLGNIVYYE